MDYTDTLHAIEILLDGYEAQARKKLRDIRIIRAMIDPDIPDFIKSIISETNSIEMIYGGK